MSKALIYAGKFFIRALTLFITFAIFWQCQLPSNTFYVLKQVLIGREPWSSGYGRRLMFQRSWVWIPTQYTGWTIFHIPIWCTKCVWKNENKWKEAGVGPFFIKMKQFILQSNKSFCSLIGLLFVFINNNRKVQFNNNFKIYPSGIWCCDDTTLILLPFELVKGSC